jgi:transcription termination factor NusB
MLALDNLITRRSLVQAVYRNHFLKDDWKELKTHDFFKEYVLNENLFDSVLAKCMSEWDHTYELIKKNLQHEDEIHKLTLCAIIILRCAISEFMINETKKEIIISEYVKLAATFVPNERRKINKILDSYKDSLKDPSTHSSQI